MPLAVAYMIIRFVLTLAAALVRGAVTAFSAPSLVGGVTCKWTYADRRRPRRRPTATAVKKLILPMA